MKPSGTCDEHPDRPAYKVLGAHMPRGDGSTEFKVSKRLCIECWNEWKKKNVSFEWID